MQNPTHPLPAETLRRACDADSLGFQTTAELRTPEDVVGQPRAAAAIDLGISMNRFGYNVFAFGTPGTGRHDLLKAQLERGARARRPPSDWCYVYDFAEPQRPRALEVPAGLGVRLRDDMEHLVDELRSALAVALEGDEYQTRRQMIEEEFGERQANVFKGLQERAKERELHMMHGPAGIFFAPVKDGQLLKPEEHEKLTDEEKSQLEENVSALQEELQKAMRQLPRWQRERREAVKELNREITRFAIGALLEELRARYEDAPQVRAYLEAMERDVIEHARAFVGQAPAGETTEVAFPEPLAQTDGDHPFLRRYRVNVIIDNSTTEGAPIVWEEHPTLSNLIGRVEHLSLSGTLVTDFNLIRGGALHRANGGYLVLDAREVLLQPYAWEGLKRALRARHVTIESIGESLGVVHTRSLQPEAIPLDVKVVLVGEPPLYHLLSVHDPDFAHLFRIAADFDDRMERTPESEAQLARLCAKIADEEQLAAFDRDAIARVIDDAARATGDAQRLSLDLARLRDVLCEADYWTRSDQRDRVERRDVERALSQKEHRSDRIRERVHDEMQRGVIDIATSGTATGQINALAVHPFAGFSFGRPSRVTARVRLGSGQVVDIEREVELSGPLHSKGVLILSAFLGERYALETPLSLSASLVFEQSYGGIEGDSASSAELYALLSAIGDVPLRQSVAVTGAVDQHGRVRAVGGTNEKIEGFFDVCRARGLTGDQGVVVPTANVGHLMLRDDVVDAAREGRFHVWAVDSVDRGLEILTGLSAGTKNSDGTYPAGSVNGRIARRLADMARRRVEFGRKLMAEEEK